MASEMNNVFRMLSEYSKGDKVSSDLRALFFFIIIILNLFCIINVPDI
jgi:hypothetical protein